MTMSVAITDRKLMMAPLARWSSRVALFSASLLAVGIVLHHFTSFPTPVAINLFQVCLAFSVLAVLLGVVALAQIWQRGHGGAVTAAVGILLPFMLWAWPLTFLPAFFKLPPINDISTDVANPPRFAALTKQRPRDANQIEYPGERFAKEQQKAYPDLRTFTVDRSAEETFEVVEDVVRKLKWKVVSSDAPAGGRAPKGGMLEATDQTLVVGFIDDIVVRVEGGPTQARVDIRSASRYGVGDLGQNATRVRRFLTELYTRLDAGVPIAGRKRRPSAAALKRLKERDPQRAESRTTPGSARSDAQRGRGQKETPR